jgi:hypothetical protein
VREGRRREGRRREGRERREKERRGRGGGIGAGRIECFFLKITITYVYFLKTIMSGTLLYAFLILSSFSAF